MKSKNDDHQKRQPLFRWPVYGDVSARQGCISHLVVFAVTRRPFRPCGSDDESRTLSFVHKIEHVCRRLKPLSAVFFAMPGYSTTPIWIIEFGVGAWMLCTLALHSMAMRALRGLQE